MKSLFFFLQLLPLSLLFAQNNTDLGQTKPFLIGLKGTIYPYKLSPNFKFEKKEGYSKEIEQREPLGYVYTQSLNISERELDAPFPGLIKKTNNWNSFAIIYTGKFEVKDSTEYEFILKSDDGSRLWIDSIEVINHDGVHQFSEPKKGKIALNKGFHNMKVWYFQGMPTRMGLLLLVKSAKDKDFKPFDLKPLEDEAKAFMQADSTGKVKVNFNDKFLFDFKKSELKPEATEQLSKLAKVLFFNPNAKVRVEGHTDNVGSAQANQLLSENRANAVAKALKNMGISETIQFDIKGFGFTQPLVPNTSEENKGINRRVELYIDMQ
jgi:outer membrane protein OmpA-like peptidoglycan-associated protein